MASITKPDTKSLLLFPAVIGLIYSLRVAIPLYFQEEAQTSVILSTTIGLVLLVIAFFSTFGSKPSIPESCFRTLTIRWMSVFLAFALLSVLWTAAPMIEAAGYWVAWVSDIITIWLLLRNGDVEQKASSVMKGYILGGCIVAVIAWSLPVMEDLRIGDPDYLHPNATSFIFSIAIMFAIYLIHENKNWRWPGIFLALTLLRTISKTSIIAFCVAMTFYLFGNAAVSRSLKAKVGIIVSVIVAAFWNLLSAYFDTYSESADPQTLTGRTIIWASAADIAVEKPWFGQGFYSFHFLVPLLGTFQPGHAHNELLQQFFTYGVVGLFLAIGLYWIFFRQVRNAPASTLKSLAATLFIFALVRGLADTERNDLSLPLWLMTMLSILLASSSQSHNMSISTPTDDLVK